MVAILEIFTENLKRLRREAKYSQEALAAKIGVSKATIVSWEGQQTGPTVRQLIKIGEAINRHPSDFFIDITDRSGVERSEVTPLSLEARLASFRLELLEEMKALIRGDSLQVPEPIPTKKEGNADEDE